MWIGIDFGTCNSCASVVKNDTIKLAIDPASNTNVFPSSVYIESNRQVLVGQLAENKQTEDINRYKRSFKPDLGQKVPFILGEYQKQPVELVIEVIKKLKIETERQILGSSFDSDAVITVPAKYEQPLRALMRSAAQEAGFRRIELLEEPVAAAIYYASQTKSKVQNGDIFLVYDLGGGTFDATLVRRNGLRYELFGVPDGMQVGGEDFDDAIYQDLLSIYPELRMHLMDQRYKLDRLRLRTFCREIKHILSTQKVVDHSLILTGQSIRYQRTRGEVIDLIGAQIDDTITCCEQLIKRSRINMSQIRCVLLVGGSCRIPFIEERLRQKLKVEVFHVDKPEQAVSMGAAYYGDALDRAATFLQRIQTLADSAEFRIAMNRHVPDLHQSLVRFYSEQIAQGIVHPALKRWQQGQTKTLSDLQSGLAESIQSRLSSTDSKEQVHHLSVEWVKKRLPELTSLSNPICDQYEVPRDILQLSENVPQLQLVPSVPVQTNTMVSTRFVTGAGTVIVGTVIVGVGMVIAAIIATILAFIFACLHVALSRSGAVAGRMIVNSVRFIIRSFKNAKELTEKWIQNTSLPLWMRMMMLSNEQLESKIHEFNELIATGLKKNEKDVESFVSTTQSILIAAMREQAEQRAQVIWLHKSDEQWGIQGSSEGAGSVGQEVKETSHNTAK